MDREFLSPFFQHLDSAISSAECIIHHRVISNVRYFHVFCGLHKVLVIPEIQWYYGPNVLRVIELYSAYIARFGLYVDARSLQVPLLNDCDHYAVEEESYARFWAERRRASDKEQEGLENAVRALVLMRGDVVRSPFSLSLR